MPEQEIQLRQNISRRTVIRGLAGLALAMGGFGCAAPGSPSIPVPTAISLPLASVIYTYHGHSDRVDLGGRRFITKNMVAFHQQADAVRSFFHGRDQRTRQQAFGQLEHICEYGPAANA